MSFLPDPILDRLKSACEEPDFTGTRYRLISELGRGGLGIVYLAEDTDLGREVAIKVLDDTSEARVLAKLEHPGIIPVHDAGLLPDGRPFYVMKRVRGQRLDEYARSSASLGERLRVFERIAETIAFAHEQGVIHCDLKPQNVMLGPFGETLVLDWGLAKRAGSPDKVVGGTPGFMAPEQERGEANAKTDVYGLGGVLRALLPDNASRPAKAVAEKALSQDPLMRYADVPALVADVRRLLEGQPVTAYRENLVEQAGRLLSRNRTVVLLVLAYLAMRLALIFFLGR